MSRDGGRGPEVGVSAEALAKAEGRTDDRLDLAIDRALLEMLDVEPPAGLRGRVMEEIGRPTGSFVAAAGVSVAAAGVSVASPGVSVASPGVSVASPGFSVASAFRRKGWLPLSIAAAAVILFVIVLPWRDESPAAVPVARMA